VKILMADGSLLEIHSRLSLDDDDDDDDDGRDASRHSNNKSNLEVWVLKLK
jgi:hypothetical protein